MNKELYFLRSSEQNIVKEMVKLANIPTGVDPSLFTEYYGLTSKDLGLYALVENSIAGAIWARQLDENAPQLCMALREEFKDKGIGAFMMEQFLQEAGAIYEELRIDISAKPHSQKFYEKYGFIQESETPLLMHIHLEKKEVVRPSDGYDPRKWMD